MTTVFTVSVDYKEFRPETYEGVELNYDRVFRIRFDSGEFLTDLNDCAYLAAHLARRGYRVTATSSVDHFISDAGLRVDWVPEEES